MKFNKYSSKSSSISFTKDIEYPNSSCFKAHSSHIITPLLIETFVGCSFPQSTHLLFSSSIVKIKLTFSVFFFSFFPFLSLFSSFSSFFSSFSSLLPSSFVSSSFSCLFSSTFFS